MCGCCVMFCESLCIVSVLVRSRVLVVVIIDLYEIFLYFFFQAEDGIRYLVRSRGLGDVYKRQDRLQRGQRTDRQGLFVLS